MFPNGFQTSRLLLRPIAPGDADPIFVGYARDPEVTRFLTWRPHSHIGETEAYITDCLSDTSSRTYVLIEKSSGKLCGAFALRRPASHRLGYGYVLAKPFWGQGLMTEALREIADWAMKQPEIWRIGDVCDVENTGSARVMEKAGLKREGLLRRWMVHPNLGGEPRDCFSFARSR